MEDYRGLADYIRTRAQALGHNTVSLSEALGYGRSYINSVVNGQFRPSVKRCRRIAQFFGDDPNIILELAGYAESTPDDSLLDKITRGAASLSQDQRRQLLEYIQFLKQKSIPESSYRKE